MPGCQVKASYAPEQAGLPRLPRQCPVQHVAKFYIYNTQALRKIDSTAAQQKGMVVSRARVESVATSVGSFAEEGITRTSW